MICPTSNNMMTLFKKLDTPYVFSRSTRIKMLCASVLIAFMYFVIGKTYRPYIYSHNIFDYHIADSFSDFLAVPSTFLFCCAIISKVEIRIESAVTSVVTGLILYEIIGNTFDYYDMMAAVISGFPTLLIMRKVFPDWR